MKAAHRIVITTVICVMTGAAAGLAAADRDDSRIPAPANVSAIPGSGKVKVTWSPVAGAAGYRVYRAVNGVWQPTPVASTTSTSHVSDSLVNGTTYSFTVAAFTKGGDGPLSLSVSATPLAAPQAVTSIAGDRRVSLQWASSAGATSYSIYRRIGAEPEFVEIATGVTSSAFVDLNLVNGTRHQYVVRAISAAAESEPSIKVSATPFSPGGDDITAVSLTPRALPDAFTFCEAHIVRAKPGWLRRFFQRITP